MPVSTVSAAAVNFSSHIRMQIYKDLGQLEASSGRGGRVRRMTVLTVQPASLRGSGGIWATLR